MRRARKIVISMPLLAIISAGAAQGGADPSADVAGPGPNVRTNEALPSIERHVHVPAAVGAPVVTIEPTPKAVLPESGMPSIADAEAYVFAFMRILNREVRYPDGALRRGEEGDVWLLLKIDPDGRTATVTVAASSGSEELDREAVAAVGRMRSTPEVSEALRTPRWFAKFPIVFRLAK